MKHKKRALFQSVMALILCLSMLVGTTFAWFTDSVSSGSNIIQSGNLKVSLEYHDDLLAAGSTDWKDASEGAIFNYENWEPGFIDLKYLKISNEGNLAFQYQLTFAEAENNPATGASEEPGQSQESTPETQSQETEETTGETVADEVAVLAETTSEAVTEPTGDKTAKTVSDAMKLAEVIDVYYANVTDKLLSREDAIKTLKKVGTLADMIKGRLAVADGILLTAKDSADVSAAENIYSGETTACIMLKMREDAGNAYMGLSAGNGFCVKLVATQYGYEKDTFGKDYDTEAAKDAFKVLPGAIGGISATASVETQDGLTTSEVNLGSDEGGATVPAGVQVNEGTTELTLAVSQKESTDSGITKGENENLIPLDVHIDGISPDNTTPIQVNLGKILPEGMNIGNVTLYHVETSGTNPMTQVLTLEELDTHNEFYYDPATGYVTVSMATFSELTVVSEDASAWKGNFDYTWYDANADELTIANADQLAAFGAIVGGMAEGIEADDFAGQTVKLIADINLGDKEDASSKLFYPIGYYNDAKSYTKPEDGAKTAASVSSFSGTFDGQGHTIANIYQNTWQMWGNYDGNNYKIAMGLFGYVVNGIVKNLTVDNFSSDGEFTPTGVIAAYAVNSTFENIAITNCKPRVYNTGNGGIVGIGGNEDDPDTYKLTFTNITIDNSNTITSLWGSWDTACGGLVGMFRGAGHAYMTNCHVAAQIDVYNDVCGNYQYYWYRYSGMMIGTNKNMITDDDGYTVPETSKFHAENCTVHFGEWNDYYYCELVANSLASYTHDHQFSRLTEVKAVDGTTITYLDGKTETVPASGNYNYVVVNGQAATENATCYHFVNGAIWDHSNAGTETVNEKEVLKEDKQHVYLPFNQLFTGYGWGVKHVPVYNGENYAFEGITILDRKVADSVVKFKTKFTGDFMYRVGNQNEVSLGSLFEPDGDAVINDSGVWVTITSLYDDTIQMGTFEPNITDWEQGEIKFDETGMVKVTIQDYNFCTPTVLYLEVVDAVNATSATNANSNNVVLLNDIGAGFTVSGRYAVYGNGFTLKYTGNGQYLNNGLKQGVVTVSENGTLDNLRIEASIYPASYLYYEEVKAGPSSTEGDKTRYHYQLSSIVATGNATISNCYVYGGRNNIYIGEGNVTIDNSILECGSLSNVQIQSCSDYTVTLKNVTTIQHRVNATIGNPDQVMLGAGVIVGPETSNNPTIVLADAFKQYNWVTENDMNALSDGIAKTIIDTALKTKAFNHTIDGVEASNMGIIYLNKFTPKIVNNTGLPYDYETVQLMTESGQVYSLKNATAEQIYSDYINADKTTSNGEYAPQFKYSTDLGGQYIAKTDEGDEFCYREGDTIKIMFPSGDTRNLDLAALATVEKYSAGDELTVEITCKDSDGNDVELSNSTLTLSEAGEYTVTYAVAGTEHSWDTVISVSLKDTKLPNAYFEFDSSKQVIYRSGNSNIVQFIPFLAGMKIYDYNGQTSYLRFDGDNDFNKIAKASINNINTTGEGQGYHIVTVELTDGGKLVIDMDVRANSGSSTHSGSIKVRNNVLYVVNGGTTSGKGQTWTIYSYKFIGNNGTEIDSGLVTFGTAGVDCDTATKPSSNFSTTVKYTVTYDANSGNCGQTTGYATSAATAVTLPFANRSGYIFAGWYTAASGGTRVGGAGESYTPSANIALYAQWGKPFTVTYDANGGSCGTASEKYTGTALTLPTPTRDGYWFIGWYDAATGGNKIGDADAKYNPMNEITLYAHWQEAIKYTVTYNANGGSCGTASATYEGTALTLPTPTRTGYAFNGWHTAASGGTKIGDADASYIPSANITLYAQWKINSYIITVTTNNATVKVNGTTVNNNGTVSIQYGAQVTVEVTYSESNDRSTTITGTDGTTYTSPFTMPAQGVTINATSSGCVTPDTLITLANGKQVRVDALTGNEQLLVWNMETGKLDSAPIMFVDSDPKAAYEVIHLYFSDGTDVKVISEHGFWDYDLNRYVYLDRYADKYIGHTFAKQSGSKLAKVKLTDVVLETELTTAWSPVTAGHLCYFVNGMLSMPGGVGGLFNIFDVDPATMTYDYEAMAKDIEAYGLFTYEEMNAMVPLSEDMFNAAGGAYLKISIGKGNMTLDDLVNMIQRYSKYI